MIAGGTSNSGPNRLEGSRGGAALAPMEPPERFTLVPAGVPGGAPRNVAQAYARLARLPSPVKEPVNLGELVKRVASLETRIAVRVVEGGEVMIEADAAQLEQLLINLLHNAAEAALETAGRVTAGWRDLAECVEVFVRDTGPGIMNPTNLFVPFFTTKPGGSGIGLALSRQIAEAHGGSLTLANRAGPGCEALLRLPK